MSELICPDCKTKIEDKHLLECPNCKRNLFDYLKNILAEANLIQEKIDKAKKATFLMTEYEDLIEFKIGKKVMEAFWSIVFIIITGLTVIGITNYRDVHENIKKINNAYSQEMNKVEHEVNNNVQRKLNKEFNTENMHALMERTLQEHTNDIIKQEIDDRTAITYKPIQNSLNDKIKQYDKLFIEAIAKQKEFEEFTEISQLILHAENDSRVAYDELAQIVNGNSKYSELAAQVILTVRGNFHLFNPGYVNVSWKNGIDPEKVDIIRYREEYSRSLSIYHADFVNLIDQSKIISKKEKMQFFTDILKKDSSLSATNFAGLYFCELAQDKDLKWDPFTTDLLLNWWDAHKDKIQ